VTHVLIERPKYEYSTRATVANVWRKAVFWPKQDAAKPGQIDSSTVFSPLTQVRRVSGDDTAPPYRINRLGLVDNEGPSAATDAMPEKPNGMIRLILFGGSTAMGIGAPDGTHTITAQLERLLNKNAKLGALFQVLNFGHGGSQTYSDLSFMTSMGVHLDPDVCISLNGFNDAFFATESSGVVVGVHPYLINWSDFSYYYHDAVTGLLRPKRAALPLLPFTSALFNSFMEKRSDAKNEANQFYSQMSVRLVTEQLEKSNPLRDRLLLENLRFTAGYFINRERIFLSYLQPHPMQFHRPLPDTDEGNLIKQSIDRISRLPYDDYRKKMIAQFDAYGKRYEELSKEYSSYPNIRFFDTRNLFEDVTVPAYIDIIHYSPAGQQLIAERMFNDLKKLDIVRKNSNSPP
jgi:hypothetical protein